MSLCALGLGEAAADIREGRITSAELVGDCLARIEEVDGEIQAWAFLDRDHAMRQAEAADGSASRANRWGRCTACRSASRTSSTPATCRPSSARPCGSGRTPRRDAAAVARLRAAGAVIMGKTVTTEYAYFIPARPPTRTTRAARPAAPPAARRRRWRPHGAGRDRLADQRLGDPPGGVLRRGRLQADARADSRAAGRCCCRAPSITSACSRGPSRTRRCWPRRSPASTRRIPTRARSRDPPLAAIATSEPPLPPRLAFVRSPAWEHAEPVTREAFAELVEALGEAVAEVELGASFARALDLHRTIMEVEMAHNLHRDYEQGGDHPQRRAARAHRARPRAHRGRLHGRGRRRSRRSTRRSDAVFDEYDAILTPAAPGEAPRGLETTGDPVFCTLWTYLGIPAVTLPLLLVGGGDAAGRAARRAPRRRCATLAHRALARRDTCRQGHRPETGERAAERAASRRRR